MQERSGKFGSPLTKLERETLEGLANGMQAKQITPNSNTASSRVRYVRRKLGAKTNEQLMAMTGPYLRIELLITRRWLGVIQEEVTRLQSYCEELERLTKQHYK